MFNIPIKHSMKQNSNFYLSKFFFYFKLNFLMIVS